MTQKSRSKKLVYVSEDIIDRISEISRKKGSSVTWLVEDVLRQAVKIDSLGFTTEEMADVLEVIQVQRVLGGTFMPLDVLNFTSDVEQAQWKEQLRGKWFESGKLYGRYIRERFADPMRTLLTFLRAMRWDLNEVGMNQNGGDLKVRCLSTSLSLEGTVLLSKFIEGAIDGIGFKITNCDLMKGMIVMTVVGGLK